MKEYPFPDGFRWGAATAAYQIEGAPAEDGKGESIWDRFVHTPGRIMDGDTGDIACDHYHRFREDVEIMADLCLNSYRFSVSWPRIFPDGKGTPNRKGLDFYRRLIAALHEKNIRPMITLFHWDLPQALQDKGGWVNRDTALYFGEYASFLFNHLDREEALWVTINEPWVFSFMGHAFGVHAPGMSDFTAALQAGHHLLLGHGLAVNAFRQSQRRGEGIGLALDLNAVEPYSPDPADEAAARRMDGFGNRWFLDPLFKGEYPQDTQDLFASRFGLPQVEEGDMNLISAPIDFLGINNYTRQIIKAAPGDDFLGTPYTPPDAEYTEMGWEVAPQGLYDLLVRVHREYGPLPLYITENGAAFDDRLEEGRVLDDRRINFLREYIFQVWRAIRDGVPVKGYYVWTVMDNFEWAFGYSKRFGLIYVDYEDNRRRIWKESGRWYRDLAATNILKR